jgi:hypothetical protein
MAVNMSSDMTSCTPAISRTTSGLVRSCSGGLRGGEVQACQWWLVQAQALVKHAALHAERSWQPTGGAGALSGCRAAG